MSIVSQTLEVVESQYNGTITVVRMLGWGTILRAANLTQSGGILYDIWKKSLKNVHGKIATLDEALIIGLGGGSLVKVIHKFWHEAHITGVDIDPLMIEMGKKYLGLREDEVRIVVSDAMPFIKKEIKLKKTYDLICVDTYNGDSYPPQFEGKEFIDIVKKLLKHDGMVVFNRLYYGEKRPQAAKFGRFLEKNFKKVEVVYPEANVMFICSN